MKPRAVDLFCGGGGSSWGAMKAGAEIICGVDAWPIASQTFAANFPRAQAIDLRLQPDTNPAVLGEIGKVDLLLASPECTNHTCAKGGRPRDEESRSTANYVTRFAQALEPRWVVVENVPHMRRWQGYNPLISDLESLGYHVRPQVLDAADFGVPQSRRRLFLLCDREILPAQVMVRRHAVATVINDILEPQEEWLSRPLYRPGRAISTLQRAERAIAALGAGIPFLIVYYGSDGSGGWQSLDRPLRTLTTLDRFGLVTWHGDIPMLRMLQVPELRRAMGFCDNFQLPAGSRRDRIRLLGNGVCPPVMQAIVASLANHQTDVLAAE